MINKQRVLDEFFELVKIRCSTQQEREIAGVLKPRLEQNGFTVREDDAGEKSGGNCGNLIGYLPGTVDNAPAIMMSAHMDCVEPCEGIQPQTRAGMITSSGDTILGADDKSGVVAILEAVRVVREQNIPHGDIEVVFTIGEESGLYGARNIQRQDLKADFAYVLDSSGPPGKIIQAAPGEDDIKVTIHGKTAHAGIAPEQGVNAIVVAGKAVAAVRQGRIDAETTANVGVIHGGRATNIVPDEVEILCEVRSRSNEKLDKQTREMCAVFDQTAHDNQARAEITVERAYDTYCLGEDAPVIRLVRRAMESIGMQPDVTTTGGGSDANYFNLYKLPSVVLGTGMAKAHTTEECIREDDLYKTAELALAIITTAGKSRKGQ